MMPWSCVIWLVQIRRIRKLKSAQKDRKQVTSCKLHVSWISFQQAGVANCSTLLSPEKKSIILSYKRSLPVFLVETFFNAFCLSFEVVCIATAPTINELFAFSSLFVKIVAWDVPLAWTGFLWKEAGLRSLTSCLACGKSFEVVCIATASTIDELSAFSSHLVKIVAWKIGKTRTCLTW